MIDKIKKNPKCSILFYGKKEKIQLRVKADCEINYNNENSLFKFTGKTST